MPASTAPTPARELARFAQEPLHRENGRKPIQVLLVEDDRETAEMLQIRLTGDPDLPFWVEWASGLVPAMIRLSQPGIDVVLLDLGLPELRGYKSYQAIEAATERKLPIVVYTSDESRLSIEFTLGLGAAGYLLKHQNSPAQLQEALRNAVRHRPDWV